MLTEKEPDLLNSLKSRLETAADQIGDLVAVQEKMNDKDQG
jgi:hypothetical protein